MAQRYEFCVIGRGMIGAAAARHLARAGASVALVGPDEPEVKETHTGVFASHYDEGRITRITDPNPVWALLAAASIARYPEIEADGGVHFYGEVGNLTFTSEAVGMAHVERVAANGEAAGAEVERLDPPSMAAAFPSLRFPGAVGGVLQRRSAGYVSPRRLVEAQSRGAERHGATLVRDYAVSVQELSGAVEVKTADGTVVRADRVIVAAGGFSNFGLLPVRLRWTVNGRTVVRFEVDSALDAALGPLPSIIGEGTWLGERHHFYALPPIEYPDGRRYFKIGGGGPERPLETLEQAQAWFRGSDQPLEVEELISLAHDLAPALRDAPTSWLRCAVTSTSTGYPYLGPVSDRVFVAAGGNGTAAKSSDEIGRLAAIVASDQPWPAEYRAEDFAVVAEPLAPRGE